MTRTVVSLVAHSGTGKTTLMEKLIAELKQRGLRVGAIKHDAHKFEIDRVGKDSWRFTQAGADTMLISSAAKLAMVKINHNSEEPSVEELISTHFNDVDIVLTEGFKRSTQPKIEVYRQAHSDELLCRGDSYDEALIAVAADVDMELDVPLFNINDPVAICDFIVERFLSDRQVTCPVAVQTG